MPGKKLSPEQLKACLDQSVEMMREMVNFVHPYEIGQKVVYFDDGRPGVIELRMSSKERNIAEVQHAARRGGWRCCVLVWEVWLGEPPPDGEPDNREEAIMFIAEAPGIPEQVREFSINRMPDDTIRFGDERFRGDVKNVFSRFGRIFGRPERN